MAKAAETKKPTEQKKFDQKPEKKKDLRYDKDAYQDQAWEKGVGVKCAPDESDYNDEA
jgi:hypothetical protein